MAFPESSLIYVDGGFDVRRVLPKYLKKWTFN